MIPEFKDHFSSIAKIYAAFRPTYPDGLFAWLAENAPGRKQVWDCACGNGQASQDLAKHFDRVVATDASAEQIAQATLNPKIEYRVASAENSGLPNQSVDLVTVAQALHWFDFDAFYAEAQRVLKPRGILAAWGYSWVHVDNDDAIDAFVMRFQKETLGPYWPQPSIYLHEKYTTIPFPFGEIAAPRFEVKVEWTLPQLIGHFRSWSAAKAYATKHNADPAATVEKELAQLWGDPNMTGPLSWEFIMRAGRV